MSADKISQLEILLERKLSEEETVRLRRIKEVLHIPDDDALWDIIAAMEYQRTYYEALPQKITGAATEILHGISVAAEKETVAAQNRLADSVVEQAKKLAGKIDLDSLLPLGVLALVCLLLYGSLLLWAGYSLGSGRAHPPALLRMPSGFLIGGLCLVTGLFLGFLAAREYVEGQKGSLKRRLLALAFLVPSSVIFSFAV